jgi:ATP-dependent exoDNAse (exonuclease V) beta subunit
MDGSNQIYACEIGSLARELMADTPVLLRRLESLYDEILIDEVQDLNGYNWEIVHELLGWRIDVRMGW